MKFYYLWLAYFSFPFLGIAQSPSSDKLLIPGLKINNYQPNFKAIPEIKIFQNELPVHNQGGHLQGVQTYQSTQGNFVFLSGSSSEYAYLCIVGMGFNNTVAQVKILNGKPLKHAGGFQICENYLAIGVEDNEQRNYSVVSIYDVSVPLDINPQPVYNIERKGEYERATAGCVALAFLKGNWLLVVGDWNTRYLDFYVSIDHKIENGFYLKETLLMKMQDRSEWMDTSWMPYQNINLHIVDRDLYLFGMTSLPNKNNLVDIYRIDHEGLNNFQLKKIIRRELENDGGDFIWGAGTYLVDGEIRGLISCDRNLNRENHLYYYPILDH